MPEVIVERALEERSASPVDFRLVATFVAAMDRAREADRLWFAGRDLFFDEPWVFSPRRICERSFTELADVLLISGVSQRHLADAAAWRRIAESVLEPTIASDIHRAIFEGEGDVRSLLDGLQGTTPAGTKLFPFLSGPKVGPMWIRIPAFPGAAKITSLDALRVAVDVQVRKVTEYLGVTETRGRELERVRSEIQETWHRDVVDYGASGPVSITNTDAALDPALWFYAKWGCTACEWAGRRRAISEICRGCGFDSLLDA